MSLKKDIVQGYILNKNFKGRIIVICYFIMRFYRKTMNNKFTFFLYAPIIILYKFITDLLLGCEIPATTKIGRGLIIHQWQGISDECKCCNWK